MPRGKKSSLRGGSHRVGIRGARRAESSFRTAFIPFSGSSTRDGRNALTLQDEARNTERYRTSGDSDRKLRHSKVDFISAGRPTTAEPNDPETALAGMRLDSSPREESHAKMEVEIKAEMEIGEDRRTSTTSDPQLLFTEQSSMAHSAFFIDVSGEDIINTGLSQPRIHSPSPTPSDSSEEVILFGGRNRPQRSVSKPPDFFKTIIDPVEAKDSKVEGKIHEQEELLEQVIHASSPSHFQRSARPLSPDFEAILPKREKIDSRRGRHYRRSTETAQEDALIADYLANIEPEDVESPHLPFHDHELGGTEDELWQDEAGPHSTKIYQNLNMGLQEEWDLADIHDLDGLSTSDSVDGEAQAILSKRRRKSGLQYLVVWEGQTMDEARWVPAATLINIGQRLLIEEFEAEEEHGIQSYEKDDESTGSESGEIEKKAHQPRKQRTSPMDDEQVARLLAKQEQLGLASNELLLFDEAAAADAYKDFPVSDAAYSPAMFTSKKPRAKRARDQFPIATALADAYEGFDIMDFERPSLQKKSKGRKGKLILDDISDSELEASMQAARENDRDKKKEKKQEREKLRVQGLLGSKGGKPDLKQKYKEGMGFHSVKEEIKNFLMGDDSMLALPPMEKADRKVVHEIASAFNLKSKSAGNDRNRFPVLYRTSRTSAYVERTFGAVEARLTRRFLPRMDVGGRKQGMVKRSGNGTSSYNSAAVSYRDGDVVGGSAPELGVDNRGRAMLEKMGWSSGTALGALNNKGILQPVSHIVKTTKAGLG